MPAGASRMAERRPSISTHVLDTDRGLPARGVRVELYRQGRLVSAQQTNDDGRIADLVQGALEADRKSTRLNSSHDQISYAVFCLKKQNTSLSRWTDGCAGEAEETNHSLRPRHHDREAIRRHDRRNRCVAFYPHLRHGAHEFPPTA